MSGFLIVLAAYAITAAVAWAQAQRTKTRVEFSNARSVAIAVAGVAFASYVIARRPGLDVPMTALVLSACTVSAITDLESGFIFDAVTFPAAFILIASAFARGDVLHVAGGMAAAAGAIAFLIALTRGGMGAGDAKLAACIGALGFATSLRALQFAFIIGGIVGVYLLLSRRALRSSTLPFAPFLAAGTFAALSLGV